MLNKGQLIGGMFSCKPTKDVLDGGVTGIVKWDNDEETGE